MDWRLTTLPLLDRGGENSNLVSRDDGGREVGQHLSAHERPFLPQGSPPAIDRSDAKCVVDRGTHRGLPPHEECNLTRQSMLIQVDPLKMADLSLLPDNQKRLTDSVEQMFRAMESAIDLFPR